MLGQTRLLHYLLISFLLSLFLLANVSANEIDEQVAEPGEYMPVDSEFVKQPIDDTEEILSEDELFQGSTAVQGQAEEAVEADAIADNTDESEDAAWRPAAIEYDWVQLTSGEWLKGEIKAMYKDILEFDSDKLDLQSLEMEDVQFLKGHRLQQINIENIGTIIGTLQITGDTVEITQGVARSRFKRRQLVSFTPSGEREIDKWAIKFTLGIDLRRGNTAQSDYNSRLSAKRRTARTRLAIDYNGTLSETDAVTGETEITANNHRFSSSYDVYSTREFFYTPLFYEYFRDPFTNISARHTLGLGAGYVLIDTAETEWEVGAGPSFLSTGYVSVLPGEEETIQSAAFNINSTYDTELTDKLDWITSYRVQISNSKTGDMSHHLQSTFESEITERLDIDMTFIWDRVRNPITDSSGVTPENDDIRFIFGLTYEY